MLFRSAGLNDPMRQMLVSGSMRERDSVTMQDMVREGFVSPDKADLTLDLIISVHQNFIYEAAIQGDSLDLDAHKSRFFQMFDYLLAAAK